jgi:sugar lactone lactonase YvrE
MKKQIISFMQLTGAVALCIGFIACKKSGGNSTPKTAIVSTFAGNGTEGYADGTGTAAAFYRPDGIAIDGSGNLYVGDMANNRIRKITPAGVVSTLAGSGAAGYADGTGTSAQFYYPAGIAIDASGNLYVADWAGNRIRKVTSAGVVSTLAGNGTAGFADGTGTSAQFNNPIGIAIDASGNLYVADEGNNRVRKITSGGVVTTIAGNGTAGYADGVGTFAQFNPPSGITIDGSGNLYVTDQNNYRIREITPAGAVTTLAGNGTAGYVDGNGAFAEFNQPAGIARDGSGNLYVTDFGNNCIRKITPASVVSTLAGNGAAGYSDGTGTSAQFNGPGGIAVDGSGNLYVADWLNNRIRKITFE